MNAPANNIHDKTNATSKAIESACNSIAPNWPLDRMIAVNPYWERIDQSFETVGGLLADIAGSPLTMPLSYYQERWQQGEIRQQHLEQAISESKADITAEELIDALTQAESSPVPAPLICDTLDRQRDLLHEPAWCDTITHQVAQFCAAFFDHEQADWRPDQLQTLYTTWRHALTHDHSVSLLMKAPHIPAKAKTLADDPKTQIQQSLEQLGIDEEDWPLYLQAILMRVSGWASLCAYRRWQAKLADNGNTDNTLVDLLAIRLAWESLIDDGQRHQASIWSRWQAAWHEHFHQCANNSKNQQLHFLWQRAHEISYQQQLFSKLVSVNEKAGPASNNMASITAESRPDAQAIFCIDVRSEVFRRHLESKSGNIQTLGFAGFFGLPISYTPIGTHASRPQLPGLLSPALDISESSGDASTDQLAITRRQQSLQKQAGWKPFNTVPASAFTLVETLGLAYAGKLIKQSLKKPAANDSGDSLGLDKKHTHKLRPSLATALGNSIEEQANIAAQVLNATGLADQLAPLVLFVGHGSQNQNNPQRAGLDCGACCGQTGEVNARALADLLNNNDVRQQLANDGLVIPEDTWFIAALHNTTTDEVQLFDTHLLPESHHNELETFKKQLDAAGLAARQERAPLLGLGDLTDKPAKLTKVIKQRANDWSQTRPEWGLANNAAFIVAPRSRTRGINLEGRSFLHDYDYSKDTDGSLLELIMTAPMVVTNWINMQYHASTVDNQRYGSGNKTLHNVVGGRLGVFEGNGGDLRIGLAKQSVHDGEKWCHEPLRLTVVIDAPKDMIEAVIKKHEVVQNLLHNNWLYLARFEGNNIESYQNSSWEPEHKNDS